MDTNDSFVYDLDLFLTDPTWGKIHLATAGGHVRDEIYKDSKHLETKINLQKSTNTDYEYKLNPNLDKILKLGNPEINFRKFNKEMYLRDFIFYAKKGYFSFDKTYVNKPLDFHYHLVAYPVLSDHQQEKDEIIHKAFIEPVEMHILK
ncbi:hypothetical protein BBH99_14470 [Chryseobacterium contaminans]|uniref:Uncharacterized protein n=1 Tax=Chryseobacterium contaminans TaxID=1423959 RepID=A0A1M7CGX0_9FLAO|nr:hypothetical protein [Chryseobacterium contaminans]OCA70329.1 hypothetical protein BBH99_14470 [Chryseobacterium contaminans]SHL66426.1 hypothetical protein SAMN05444407_105214 [Chryseobacterium contaminans]